MNCLPYYQSFYQCYPQQCYSSCSQQCSQPCYQQCCNYPEKCKSEIPTYKPISAYLGMNLTNATSITPTPISLNSNIYNITNFTESLSSINTNITTNTANGSISINCPGCYSLSLTANFIDSVGCNITNVILSTSAPSSFLSSNTVLNSNNQLDGLAIPSTNPIKYFGGTFSAERFYCFSAPIVLYVYIISNSNINNGLINNFNVNGNWLSITINKISC